MMGIISLVAIGAALLEQVGGIQTSNLQRFALGLPLGTFPAMAIGIAARVLWNEIEAS